MLFEKIVCPIFIATLLVSNVAENRAGTQQIVADSKVPVEIREAQVIQDPALTVVRDAVSIKGCFVSESQIQLRPQDELWAINARESHCCAPSLDRLRVKRFLNGNWHESSLLELTGEHLSHPELETVLYVHGNRTNRAYSILRGMHLYKNVFYCGPSTPIRFVIFQWKSDQELSRILNDYLVKSKRAIQIGKTLGLTLQEFQNRDLTIVGYSLGVQVVVSAVREPESVQIDTGKGYRLALIAPALDCAYKDRIGCSASCGDRDDCTLVFFNQMDRATKLSEMVCRKKYGRKTATFKKAIDCGLISLGLVQKFEIGAEAGKKHSIIRYSESPTVQCSINGMISARMAE